MKSVTKTLSSYRRPHIGSVTLAITIALYLLFVTNVAFWKVAATVVQGSLFALAGIATALAGVYIAFCVSVSVRFITKPVFILLVCLAAGADFFMRSFGTIISVDMADSAFTTSSAEAAHIVTRSFIMHMLLYALVPSMLVLWVRIEHKAFATKLIQNSIVVAVCLGASTSAVYAQSGTIFWIVRQHRELTGLLNPVFPIASTVKSSLRKSFDEEIVVRPLGLDAHVADSLNGKPIITVIIVGETARAENFALSGYARSTNPELKGKGVTYFTDTSSCGTMTAVSLPCMFSIYRRTEYSHNKALETENLLDVLQHAGIDVSWWDNDLGSKSVANRIKDYRKYYKSDDPAFCSEGECIDEILLRDLDDWVGSVRRDSLLVLHLEGSHGPAYYGRYPEAFRRFKPECRSSEFVECTHDEIVNAYDNTIAYTDHIIASVISTLERHDSTINPSLIFVSDHGESLGEYGLYLHGAPYFMAPSQQTHVPYLIWLGQSAGADVDCDCLLIAASQPQSHDNLFHTVLGIMGVSTSVYDASLDSLEECQGTARVGIQPLAYLPVQPRIAQQQLTRSDP